MTFGTPCICIVFVKLPRFDLVELGTHVIERLQALTSKVTQLQTLHISDTELVLSFKFINSLKICGSREICTL